MLAQTGSTTEPSYVMRGIAQEKRNIQENGKYVHKIQIYMGNELLWLAVVLG